MTTQPTIEKRIERADKIWTKLKYNHKRVLGQLCSIPPSWKAVLDREDEIYAIHLSTLDLVEHRLEGDHQFYKASDLGRDVWYVSKKYAKEINANG